MSVVSDRKNCCDHYFECFNHDSWYCDECKRNKNLIDYLRIYAQEKYNVQSEKTLSKQELLDAQERLLYDDDEMIKKYY